jgi:hypothetical protein
MQIAYGKVVICIKVVDIYYSPMPKECNRTISLYNLNSIEDVAGAI